MTNWLDSLHMRLEWTCECGAHHRISSIHDVRCACERVWRISGSLNIRYTEPTKRQQAPDGQASLWEARND